MGLLEQIPTVTQLILQLLPFISTVLLFQLKLVVELPLLTKLLKNVSEATSICLPLLLSIPLQLLSKHFKLLPHLLPPLFPLLHLRPQNSCLILVVDCFLPLLLLPTAHLTYLLSQLLRLFFAPAQLPLHLEIVASHTLQPFLCL